MQMSPLLLCPLGHESSQVKRVDDSGPPVPTTGKTTQRTFPVGVGQECQLPLKGEEGVVTGDESTRATWVMEKERGGGGKAFC